MSRAVFWICKRTKYKINAKVDLSHSQLDPPLWPVKRVEILIHQSQLWVGLPTIVSLLSRADLELSSTRSSLSFTTFTPSKSRNPLSMEETVADNSCLECPKHSGLIASFSKSTRKNSSSPSSVRLTRVSNLEKEEEIKRGSRYKSTPRETRLLELNA